MTATSAEPALTRDALAVPATVLVGIWCLASFVVGAYWFVHVTLNEHGAGSPLESDPAGSFAFLVTMLLPIAAINVLVAGIVIGAVAAVRTPPGRAIRTAAWLAVVIGGVVAQMWAWSARQ